MDGPTCIFWANLTPFSLEVALPASATEPLAFGLALMASDVRNGAQDSPNFNRMGVKPAFNPSGLNAGFTPIRLTSRMMGAGQSWG
jgi:hypothetical protein